MDPGTGSSSHHRRLTSGKDTWSAGCAERCTPGAGGGPRETTGGNADTAPVGLPHSPATEQPGIRRLRIGLPARQWRLRDACGLSCLNDFLALWSQALAFLAVTHRYKRTHCLWLEQFQIAEYALVTQ
jgi:hypothetical protein